MKITAVVPTYNEEKHIGRCLSSLLAQRGIDDCDIIVVDGNSRDKTLDVVRSFPDFGIRIRVLENPRRFQVFAWNLGCKAATTEYVAMISAHSEYGPDHFRLCLEALERAEADAIGPVQVAEGSGVLGKAIAWCMSTPFGIGNARFRFTDRQEEVDSVFSMILRRETFEQLGGYDERLAFDEDSEFSYRLRAAGGRILVTPASRVRYFVRESLKGLTRQMFCYGFYRRYTQLLHPQEIPPRVYAPPALIAGLLVSAILAFTSLRVLAGIVPALYLGFLLMGCASSWRKLSGRSATLVPVVLACMHLWYGAGFWRAMLSPRSYGPLRSATARLAN